MSQHSHYQAWDTRSGWATISVQSNYSFTLWFTGLPGSGKMTLAYLVKQALELRGYRVEIIDSSSLSRWLQQELHIAEPVYDDQSHMLAYDAFITHMCSILSRNSIVTITTAVSPYREARGYAREKLPQFIEIYLHCPAKKRRQRLRQAKHVSLVPEQVYEPPVQPELTLHTEYEPPEQSALRIVTYLEQNGYIATLWNDVPPDEEIEQIKARLQALGYLE